MLKFSPFKILMNFVGFAPGVNNSISDRTNETDTTFATVDYFSQVITRFRLGIPSGRVVRILGWESGVHGWNLYEGNSKKNCILTRFWMLRAPESWSKYFFGHFQTFFLLFFRFSSFSYEKKKKVDRLIPGQ